MNGAGAIEAGLPRPGEVIAAKYRIESVIGTGGMGVVMGATDVTLGRAVAIKFLSPHKLAREGARERFLREARAAAQIQSEHVVRVYEVGETALGAPFIVMEHLRGADLSDVLRRRGGLPVEEAVDYVLQTCAALGEAHARGIVHRDLKPQNLFLTQRPDGSPCVKVLDFGISKAADDTAQNLTATDMVMGTPLYMSPEQVRSLKNVDARADVWALGAILFELLTASTVFDAPSLSALCAMIATDPPVPLRARRPHAPPELEAVILRCLHKDPAGRFQNVGALAAALAPFASRRGTATAQQAWNAQPFPPRASKAPLVVLGVLVVLVLAGAAGALLWMRAGAEARAVAAAGSAATSAAPSTTTATMPTVSATATATTTATSASPIKPVVVKDAGAPQAPKDAGAAPKPNDDAERDALLARKAQERCDVYTRDMTTFARTDADRKRAAERAKSFTCLKGVTATSCERQVCMQACGILNDGPCLQQMRYAIDHGPKPPY